MPRTLPPPHQKGTPRTPGSGRKKGTLNRRSIELRELTALLVNDLDYQSRFREDFRKRRVHPSTEMMVWAYAIGKPTEQIEMSALSMDARFAAEREALCGLNLEQLEALLAESQALIDGALARAKTPDAIGTASTSPHRVLRAEMNRR